VRYAERSVKERVPFLRLLMDSQQNAQAAAELAWIEPFNPFAETRISVALPDDPFYSLRPSPQTMD
jgi:hypothetical protein